MNPVEYVLRPGEPPAAALSDDLARLMADAIPHLAWMAQPDGFITWYNRRWYEYTGATPAQMAGWGWQSAHDPATLPFVLARWGESIRTGQPFEMEFPLRGQDGKFRPFLTRAVPVRDAAGTLLHWVGTNIHISALRESEAALRLSEARFRSTFDEAPVGIAHVAPDDHFLRVNPALCEITGYTGSELKALTFADITHPDDLHLDVRQVGLLADGKIHRYTLEKRYLRKNGSIVWINLTGSAVRDEQGQLVHFIAIIEDITGRRQAEATLRLALDSARLIAFVWDIPTNAVRRYHNSDTLLRRVEMAPDTFEGVRGRVLPEDRHGFDLAIQASMVDPQGLYHAEFRLIGTSGTTRWLTENGRVEFDIDGHPLRLVGLSQDITERKTVELRLIEAQDELQRHAVGLELAVEQRTAQLQELVSELNTFAYSVSHDLRAPLRSIQGFAELLREEVGPTLAEPGRSHLERIIRAARRMDTLIRDVLEYSRITRAQMTIEDIDLGPIIRDTIEAQAPLRAPLADVEIEGELPLVRASRPALIQCLSNLLSNAVKFVAAGVKPRVRVRAERRGEFVRVWIEDNGIGIAPDHHERIWGMLERLNANYEGTGVGLTIVRKAVERMGGNVGVESALGAGSRFWLELPASSAAVESKAELPV